MDLCTTLAVALVVAVAAVLRHYWTRAPAISSRAWDWHQSGRRFKARCAGGLSVFYHDTHGRGVGEGARDGPAPPTVLLIHGFPTSSYDWRLVWRELARTHRLIAIDMLGFGYSAKPPAAAGFYRIASTQATLHEEVLERCGVAACHVLAHDYGDTVAQELLARARDGALPFQLQSVMFLNGGMLPSLHRPRPMQTLLAHPMFGPWVAACTPYFLFRRSYLEVFGQRKPSEADVRDDYALLCHNNGLPAMAALIGYMGERREQEQRWVSALQAAVPKRVLVGPVDPVSGGHVAEELQKVLDGSEGDLAARVVLLDGGVGHYPQVEAPEAVLEAYREFLADVEALAE